MTRSSDASGEVSAKPLLKITRPTFVTVNGKILNTTETKLGKYIEYASKALGAKCTTGDVLENALTTFFERDAGFKNYLKQI